MQNKSEISQTSEPSCSDTQVVKLVQITDSHIFADPDGCLLGLNTRDSFNVVCDRVMREEWSPDLILATGDLSQDSSDEAYQFLAQAFEKMAIPTYWIAGNHDSNEKLLKSMTRGCISAAKHLLFEHWQVILLDSSVVGKVYGELSDDQLSFLQQKLEQHPDKYSLVVLHHHPLDIGSEWLDQIGLKNKQDLTQLLANYPKVKGVLWGHIHQEYFETFDGIDWIATPSSCVQFKPGSTEFSAATDSPGYRYIQLMSNGQIETVVHRMKNIEFTVDYSIKGY